MVVTLDDSVNLVFFVAADASSFNAGTYEETVRAQVCAGTTECTVTAALVARRRRALSTRDSSVIMTIRRVYRYVDGASEVAAIVPVAVASSLQAKLSTVTQLEEAKPRGNRTGLPVWRPHTPVAVPTHAHPHPLTRTPHDPFPDANRPFSSIPLHLV